MERISVFGHKNPDNDAICSAIGAAYYLNTLGDGCEYVPVCLGELPKETQWVFEQYGCTAPQQVASAADLPHEEGARPKVFLVDHNESAQSIDGLDQCEVVGLIDHHRIGDLQTDAPLYITARPWGSSSTIVATLIQGDDVTFPRPIAAALLSALLTDTVILRSPTTTDVDREMAETLGKLVGVDPVQFGIQVIKARGGDDELTADYIISHDSKEFDFGGQRFLVAQHETVDLKGLLGRKDEVQQAMDALQAEKGYDTVLVLLTDIIEEGSEFLISGDRALVESTFNVSFDGDVYVPGVLSRKKQVAAPLSEASAK